MSELSTQAANCIKEFLERASDHLAAIRRENDIEEAIPTIGIRAIEAQPASSSPVPVFSPGGWVGSYSSPEGRTILRVYPNPEKLSRPEYEQILRDIADSVNLLGAPFWESVLRALTSISTNDLELAMMYSRIVSELTDAMIAHRVSRTALWKRNEGWSVRGKVDLMATSRRRMTDPRRVVSSYLEFSTNTPLNLLIVQFHTELVRRLIRAPERGNEPVKQTIGSRLSSHMRALYNAPFNQMIDRALALDPFDPHITKRLTSEAATSPFGRAILDSWESYTRRRNLMARFSSQFDRSLKPMSKVYELWCLQIIMRALSRLTKSGTHSDMDRGLPRTFRYGPVTLFYGAGRNREFQKSSNLLNNLSNAGLSNVRKSGGRPDFMLVSSADWHPFLLIESKYKLYSGIDDDDLGRLFTYIVDYLLPIREASNGKPIRVGILHVDADHPYTTVNSVDGQVEFHLICLRPSTLGSNNQQLEQLIANSLELQSSASAG